MGFGYLLIGYILAFAFSLSNGYYFLDVIGATVMLVGLLRLAPHGKNFLRALWADMAYLLISIARAVLLLLHRMPESGALPILFALLYAVGALALHFFLLAGIYYLAEQVELPKEMRHARRNLAMIFVYYCLHMIAYLLAPSLGDAGNILSLCILLFGIVVILLNVLLIHGCYCRICLAGQEKGERPRSRYEWLNRFRDKTDAMFDNAYLRKPKAKNTEVPPEPPEPGYLRVKRKKNQKRK